MKYDSFGILFDTNCQNQISTNSMNSSFSLFPQIPFNMRPQRVVQCSECMEGGAVTDPPFPRTTPGRSVTPARCICMGCRTGPGLGHPSPASMLKSPWSHVNAFLGRAQALARSPLLLPGAWNVRSACSFRRCRARPLLHPAICRQLPAGRRLGSHPHHPGGVWMPLRTQDRPSITVTSAIDC